MLDTPVGVSTVISTVPVAAADGAMAVIQPSLFTTKVDSAVPNSTISAPLKLLPAIFTTVPPLMEPELGLTLLMLGTEAAENVSRSELDKAEVPYAVITVTSTVSAVSAGASATI